MAWYKCSACRIRRSGLDVATSDAQDSCPLCGNALEVAVDLESLVGLRYVTSSLPLVTDEAVAVALPDPATRMDENGRES